MHGTFPNSKRHNHKSREISFIWKHCLKNRCRTLFWAVLISLLKECKVRITTAAWRTRQEKANLHTSAPCHAADMSDYELPHCAAFVSHLSQNHFQPWLSKVLCSWPEERKQVWNIRFYQLFLLICTWRSSWKLSLHFSWHTFHCTNIWLHRYECNPTNYSALLL